MNDKYEVVKFEQDGLTLDVNVSPSEDTVWLTQDAMALLFGRNQGVFSRHINNIFKEGELDRNTSMQKMHKSRNTSNPNYRPPVYYNLDVVISVGYRVKSHNGIIFRRWANSVLKEYLLKGYVLDQDRTLITNDNYVELVHRVNNIDNRLSKLESDNHIDNEKIFFDGELFDARSFIKDIFTRAKEEFTLIDPYADIKALDYLKAKKDNVRIKLYMSKKAKLTRRDIDDFSEQYGSLEVIINDSFHDRFIILDSSILYHLGASLNYIGKKVFAITKLEDDKILSSIKNKLDNQ